MFDLSKTTKVLGQDGRYVSEIWTEYSHSVGSVLQLWHLDHCFDELRVIQRRGTSLPVERLAASQGLCTMELDS
jgi:hypothetical protein